MQKKKKALTDAISSKKQNLKKGYQSSTFLMLPSKAYLYPSTLKPYANKKIINSISISNILFI